jgi:hypothetical protein
MTRIALSALVGVMALVPLVAAPRIAFAADAAPDRCTDVSVPRTAITARNGKWIELTSEQWQFLRGVFVLNPNTPPGLPYGDKAVLAQVDGDSGGLVFFIDGSRACTPMAIPAVLVSMMEDVGAETIPHEAASGL